MDVYTWHVCSINLQSASSPEFRIVLRPQESMTAATAYTNISLVVQFGRLYPHEYVKSLYSTVLDRLINILISLDSYIALRPDFSWLWSVCCWFVVLQEICVVHGIFIWAFSLADFIKSSFLMHHFCHTATTEASHSALLVSLAVLPIFVTCHKILESTLSPTFIYRWGIEMWTSSEIVTMSDWPMTVW